MFAPNPSFDRHQPACKPGSVGHRRWLRTIRDGHSSGTTFARCLEQPTRTTSLTSLLRRYRFRELGRVAVPIRSCSRCGLPCRIRCRTRGALLPHLFTLTAPSLYSSPACGEGRVGEAVRFLWHCPWGRPRRKLSGTVCRWSPDFPLPRAFRPAAGAAVRPTDPKAMGVRPAGVKLEPAAASLKINYPEDVVLRRGHSTGYRRSRRLKKEDRDAVFAVDLPE